VSRAKPQAGRKPAAKQGLKPGPRRAAKRAAGTKRGRVWPWALAGLLAVALGLFLYFNLWLYPGFGLGRFSRADHEAALSKAALGYAKSRGMAMEGFDLLKFREVEGGDAFVWGAAAMRPAPAEAREYGERVLVWVYLSWDGFRRSWVRVDAQVLAGPDNEMFFSLGHPGQMERARLAWDKIVVEEKRRFREVWK
jgi:hypothetical protein